MTVNYKQSSDGKEIWIKVRVTKQQRDEFKKVCQAKGYEMSGYLRAKMFELIMENIEIARSVRK